MVQKNFESKIFWFKKILSQKNFGSKNILVKKIFWSKKILVKKILDPKHFWVNKVFWSKKFVCLKKKSGRVLIINFKNLLSFSSN